MSYWQSSIYWAVIAVSGTLSASFDASSVGELNLIWKRNPSSSCSISHFGISEFPWVMIKSSDSVDPTFSPWGCIDLSSTYRFTPSFILSWLSCLFYWSLNSSRWLVFSKGFLLRTRMSDGCQTWSVCILFSSASTSSKSHMSMSFFTFIESG